MLADHFWENLTWICHFCGDDRPDALISVARRDITPPTLPEGTMRENRCYCADRLDCIEKALAWQNTPKSKQFVKRSEEDE